MMHSSVIDDAEILRPTFLEINLNHIYQNYQYVQDHVGKKKVMVILKANAYGHGLVRVAQFLENKGIPYFGVAYLEEGILLRKSGITKPILVLGGIVGNQIPLFLKYDLTMTASSVEKLLQIESQAKILSTHAKVHLKIDTGMERIGIHYYSAEKLLEASLKCRYLEVEGIFSHFANADAEDLRHAHLQLERFRNVLTFYENRSVEKPLVHMANSSAILRMPEAHFDMVRPGIILFGIYPSYHIKKVLAVRPALTWKTRVVFFKVVKPNHPVSYGSTWTSNKMTRIVTLPIGYGDGYMRAMSDKARVIIRGKSYPTVGSICMDQVMVDIGWNTAYNDDEVILVGKEGNEEIHIEDLSNWANTIPYEILTSINTRVPRKYLSKEVKVFLEKKKKA